MLVSFKEMGVNVLVNGDSICTHKSERALTRTWTLGGDGASHHGGSVWDSFTRSVGQDQEVNTGIGDMEDKGEGGLDRANMELIRGFLVYAARTCQDMNIYLKELHLTLDSSIPFRDDERWQIQGEQRKLVEMDR